MTSPSDALLGVALLVWASLISLALAAWLRRRQLLAWIRGEDLRVQRYTAGETLPAGAVVHLGQNGRVYAASSRADLVRASHIYQAERRVLDAARIMVEGAPGGKGPDCCTSHFTAFQRVREDLAVLDHVTRELRR